MVEIISWFLSNGIITNSDVPEEATEKKRKMYSRGHAQALKTTGKQGIFGMRRNLFFFFPFSFLPDPYGPPEEVRKFNTTVFKHVRKDLLRFLEISLTTATILRL